MNIMRYFWREKNAEKCVGKYEVKTPTKKELEKELIAKLEQKIDKIDAVFNKNARIGYYRKQNKTMPDFSKYTEKQIQQKLGARLVVDFLQLSKDLCDFYDIDSVTVIEVKNALSYSDIKSKETKAVQMLKSYIKNNTNPFSEVIFLIDEGAWNLAKLLNLTKDEIFQLFHKVNEKEGSFFNGKYVLINDGDC